MNARPALWAGVEPTVNRVGDVYFDQCRRNGHRQRLDDIDEFAALGITALRQPVLWETAAGSLADPAHLDLGFADAPLARLRRLGVEPIVGLIHHGSGPPFTSLLDDGFAEGLAIHARAVARRYPWVRDYTPVNEPLTTARFSALYGHWYPHCRDERAFTRALLNQCRATVLAMRAIRNINPEARLIQTEDAGRTYATPLLSDQAEFENHRRWLAFDLLMGRVDRTHVLYEGLLSLGAGESELAFFLDHPTPPDVVGLNYYVTSDRMLDERVDLYPASCHGGNGRQVYADTEAARARPEGITGHRAVLETAWARYGLPLALTEVHIGCSREEQLRWLREAWDATCDARAAGIDARAVTVWSLLGAYDWNSLVTQDRGYYEPGAFDLRNGSRRPTAICHMVRALAREGVYHHPLMTQAGWWRRPDRLLPGLAGAGTDAAFSPAGGSQDPPMPPLLIVGGGGTLGRAFSIVCARRGIAARSLAHDELDIADAEAVRRVLDMTRPWAVVNAAGYVQVDLAEAEPACCFRDNVAGPVTVAKACAARGIPLVIFSSDLVFDGRSDQPYAESDRPRPLNTYGRSKREAEQRVLEACCRALVIRTSAFFGPWDVRNFLHDALTVLGQARPFYALDDVTVSPTYVPDLVEACLDLLVDGESGLWHVTNAGSATWLEVARQAATLAGLDVDLVKGRALARAGLPAPRPAFTAMRSERGLRLPSLTDALGRFLRERALQA